MSNYTKTTDFATKDSLPSGNPAKIVKGTEIDIEFNNIAVAVATKADSATAVTVTGNQTLTNKTFSGVDVDGDINLTSGASDWSFTVSGNNLLISYGGTNKAKLDTSGNLTVVGTVTANGTI